MCRHPTWLMIMPNTAEHITTKSAVAFNYGWTYQKLYWSTKQWEASPQVAWDPCCKLLLQSLFFAWFVRLFSTDVYRIWSVSFIGNPTSCLLSGRVKEIVCFAGISFTQRKYSCIDWAMNEGRNSVLCWHQFHTEKVFMHWLGNEWRKRCTFRYHLFIAVFVRWIITWGDYDIVAIADILDWMIFALHDIQDLHCHWETVI